MNAQKTILLLGGTGNFGQRIYDRLKTRNDLKLIIPSRKAGPGTIPIPPGGLTDLIGQLRPFLVIDAGGLADPDQGEALITACLAANAHFIDLSADRRHLKRIERFDAAAKEKAICIIAGASSVPALTAAIAAKLSHDMTRVDRVETVLLAATSGVTGPAVLSLVLSNLGRPFKSWNGAVATAETSWGHWHAACLTLPGQTPVMTIAGNWGVADHDILPKILLGRPSSRFATGVEYNWQNGLVGLAARVLRVFPLRGIERIAPLVARVFRAMLPFSRGRSGLSLTLTGQTADGAVTRSYIIIASAHRGAFVPTIPALILTDRLCQQDVPAGARSAAGMLTLSDFQPEFDKLFISTGVTETAALGLWPAVIGADFQRMPPSLRALHQGLRGAEWHGRVTIDGPETAFGRLICQMLRLPHPGADLPARVRIDVDDHGERWQRRFGTKRFNSRLSASRHAGAFSEQIGPFRFELVLNADEDGFTMRMIGWKLGPIPLPMALAPRISANATADQNGRYQFYVAINLPFIGRIIRYQGHIAP